MENNIFSLRIKKDKVVETIKTMAYLGFFIAIFTLIGTFTFYPYLFGPITPAGQLINVIISLIYILLSFGVYFKSRVFAILLSVAYVIDTVLILISFSTNEINPSVIIVRIFFFWIFFVKGTKAVFVYHKHIKNKNDN